MPDPLTVDPFSNPFATPNVLESDLFLAHNNENDNPENADLFRKHSNNPDDLKFQDGPPTKIPKTNTSSLHSHRTVASLFSIQDPRLEQLYFVHYVKNDNTLQGISLKYDCPIQHIKKINRIHSISHSGDIRIRKIVLVPMKYTGDKLRTMNIYAPPHPERTIHDEYEEDVEQFLDESFSYDNDRRCLDHDTLHFYPADFANLPGSVISRSVWSDLSSEFKSLSQQLQGCLNNYLYGFCLLDGLAEAPTFIIEVPSTILNKFNNIPSFGRKTAAVSLPTPKPSLEEEEKWYTSEKSNDPAVQNGTSSLESGFSHFLSYLLNLSGIKTNNHSKTGKYDIELNNFH